MTKYKQFPVHVTDLQLLEDLKALEEMWSRTDKEIDETHEELP